MKYTLLLALSLLCATVHGQILTAGTVTSDPADVFSYDNQSMQNYGLRWG